MKRPRQESHKSPPHGHVSLFTFFDLGLIAAQFSSNVHEEHHGTLRIDLLLWTAALSKVFIVLADVRSKYALALGP